MYNKYVLLRVENNNRKALWIIIKKKQVIHFVFLRKISIFALLNKRKLFENQIEPAILLMRV